ncbi:MAG TPA: phosphate ABC transporter substrate-binding protein PstS [Blastocatellia bacterium]
MSNKPSLSRILAIGFAAALLAFGFAACGSGSEAGGGGSVVKLEGAGATFPNPLYQQWFTDYNKGHANSKFDYQSIGSGGGQTQILSKTIDFGGSDVPMTNDQLKGAPDILHIPTVLGAVVITDNLPSVPATTTLKFSGQTIAEIYLGTIKKWNDPKLAQDNPGVTFPDADITVVHRSDASGTSGVFSDYLSKVSPEWQQKVGAGTALNWPVGVGAKGNEGVTGQVKQTPNSIGYVELIYAQQNKLPYADVKDADGEFVHPSLETITNAAAGAASHMPDDLRVSITNSPGKDAYPISSFTYLLVYKDQTDNAKGTALVNFLWWATHDGQKEAPALIYAPLPPEVVKKDEEKIQSITYQGKPLYSAAK